MDSKFEKLHVNNNRAPATSLRRRGGCNYATAGTTTTASAAAAQREHSIAADLDHGICQRTGLVFDIDHFSEATAVE
jgi:hypothetical protein